MQDQVPLGGVLRGLGFSPVQTGGFEAPGPGSPAPARLGRARLWLCRACFGCYPLSGELTPDESPSHPHRLPGATAPLQVTFKSAGFQFTRRQAMKQPLPLLSFFVLE